MEPIKFEDNIRQKLQEREIIPSKGAWKKLHSKLDSRPKKNNNKIIWFAVAASFIGILIITSLLFKYEAPTITNSSDFVVENPEDLEKVNNIEERLLLDKKTDKLASKETIPVEKTEEAFINKPDIINKNESELAVISANAGEESSVKSDEENTETITSLKSEHERIIIDLKGDDVVAQTQVLEKEEKSVNNEEINSLLLKAKQNINSENIIPGKTKKVDATALLNAVEDDLETSFRDKVFEALRGGFEKVKTAVIERNN